MKRILSILLLMTLAFSLSGCRYVVKITDHSKEQKVFERSESIVKSRPLYNLGNYRQLKGNVEVHLFFIDDADSSWNASAMERYERDQLTPAFRFLEEEAKRWGTDLAFSVQRHSVLNGDELYFDGSYPCDLLEEDSMPELLDVAVVGQHYISAKSMLQAYSLQGGADSVLCITALNKAGRCFVNLHQPEATGYVPEYVTLYSLPYGEEDPRETGMQSSRIAFHILRIYGAENMYVEHKREIIAEELYPNDVMYLRSGDYKEMAVGPFSAYCVGWTDAPPDVCYMPAWWE